MTDDPIPDLQQEPGADVTSGAVVRRAGDGALGDDMTESDTLQFVEGHNDGVESLCWHINRYLDGTPVGPGTCAEPWETARRRVGELAATLAALRALLGLPADGDVEAAVRGLVERLALSDAECEAWRHRGFAGFPDGAHDADAIGRIISAMRDRDAARTAAGKGEGK